MSEYQWLVLGVALTAPPALLFPLLYGLLSPWYRSATGRAVFIYAFGMGVLVSSSILRLFLGDDHPVFIYTRLAIYTFLPLGLWYLFIAYLKVLASIRTEPEKWREKTPETL